MPVLYEGTLEDKGKKHVVKCILGNDIKINIFKDEGSSNTPLLGTTANLLAGLMQRSTLKLVGSYLSFRERDKETKKFKRRNLINGDISGAHRVLELVNQSYLKSEEVSVDEYPSASGVTRNVKYQKGIVGGKIHQEEMRVNGVLEFIQVLVERDQGNNTLLELKAGGTSSAKPTKGVHYRESVFDIGDVKEKAIHTQIRSIQHLRSIKDIDWIDKRIEEGVFRILDTLEEVKEVVQEILRDLKKGGEKKVYWDTETSNLNVFNLPPDHPEKGMVAAQILTWVTKRRKEDGYPEEVKTIIIPVGMKYCDNVDEIDAAEALKPILTNPNIGVAAHNAGFDMQAAMRYSEVEGELSYKEYYRWKNEIKEGSGKEDRDYLLDRIEVKQEEIKKIKETQKGIIAKVQTTKLEKEIKEMQNALDSEKLIEETALLPKEQKPYLSRVKGEDIYRVNIKYDTMILSRMANNGGETKDGAPFIRHRLDALTKNYLDKDQLSLDDVFGNSSSSKFKIYDFSVLPREFLLYYGCPDTYVMPYIEWHLEKQAYEHGITMGMDEARARKANIELLNLYYGVDVPFTAHIAEFGNYKGIAIDRGPLDEEREKQTEIKELILDYLIEVTGEDIKWSSGAQVGALIFNKYRYPILYRTKGNAPSYNKTTRKLHKKQTKEEHEAIYEGVVGIPEMKEDLVTSWGEVILRKDNINKLQCPLSFIYQEFMDRYKDLTSFTKMIYERTYEVNGEWIYFPNYKTTATDTGRAADGIMIMKKSKKSMFIARNGFDMLGGDLDQAELRLIATMSGDQGEINRFKNTRYDPHTKTASDTNGVPMEEVTPEQRSAAKVINFGDAYGMGPGSASTNIYPNLVPVPKALVLKVAMLLKEFARANPVKADWLNNLRKTTMKVGYSKTPMGRYKWFPEVKKPGVEMWQKARAGRQGGNVPIQGFCADYIKQRIVRVYQVIKDCNISRYFTQPLFIHDEFHQEVAKAAYENAENKVYTNEMVREEGQFNLMWLYELIYRNFTETPFNLPYLDDEAPMTLGIGLGKNWDQAKSDLYGLPQELQKKLVNRYREGEITDQWHESLCKDPIGTMLNEIRTWWAEQIVMELEKHNIDPNNIPKQVGDNIEDLFLKRNLKDIFSTSPKELKEMGLEEDDWITGQVVKAVKFLRGEKVHLVDSLSNDDVEFVEDEDKIEEAVLEDIIDLSLFKEFKEDIQRKYEEIEDEYDYDLVFKESALLEFGKIMVKEETRDIEINIHGMLGSGIVRLEKAIRKLDKRGIYNVVIIGQESASSFPYKVIRTTYKIPVNENTLLQIKSILNANEKDARIKDKELARRY